MGNGAAVCLKSGRGGCDSQMMAVVRHLGLHPDDGAEAGADRVQVVVTTGPERAEEAVDLAHSLGACVVGFGQPGSAARRMDLVVTTPQFEVAVANAVRLPFAISPHGSCMHGGRGEDADAISRLPRPLGLLLVGGDAGPWRHDTSFILEAVANVVRRNRSVIVMTSSRTSPETRRLLRMLDGPILVVDAIDGLGIRLAAAIHACDEAFVTGDSVSMVSEVAAAPRPVAVLIPPSREDEVSHYLAQAAADPLRHAMPGDLRRFWTTLGPDIAVPTLRPIAMGMLHRAADAVARCIDGHGSQRAAA